MNLKPLRAILLIALLTALPALPALSQDADADGMPDSYETAFGCLMPNTVDSGVDYDTDGLPSLAEYTYSPLLNPCLADTDGGGEPDGSELGFGRNPLLAADDSITVIIGTGTGAWAYPLTAANHDARTQTIYLASELGPAGLIESIALDVITPPGQTLSNFTIRLRPTTLASYPTQDPAWESTGWTVAYQADEPPPAAGLKVFTLQTPFYHDGVSNLMVDISFNNASASSSGDVRYSNPGGKRTAHAGADSLFGDPLLWSGPLNPAPTTTNRVPNLRLLLAPDTDADTLLDFYELRYSCLMANTVDNLADPDLDTLSSQDESALGLDPCDPDTDNDGLSDGDEVLVHGTNPLQPDTDDDGMNDGYEAARPCLDPLVGDSLLDPDADTLANLAEHNLGTNPCDPDTDNDTLPDAWELQYLGCGFDPTSSTLELSHYQKLGVDLRVTNDAGFSYYPSASWTGSEFGVTWYDDRDGNNEIYFARVSADGLKFGSDLRITNEISQSMIPTLSWTGSEFGISWFDSRDGNGEIYFTRVSAAGAKVGSDLRVSNTSGLSSDSSLSWTGSEFGITWADDFSGNTEIFFTRLTAAGAKIGSDLRLTTNDGSSGRPSLFWANSEFGVSWDDYRDGNSEIYFARVSAEGVKIGSDLRLTSNSEGSWDPSLYWTGSEYGVSWEDSRDGDGGYEIYFTRVSANGVKIGSDIRVTSGGFWNRHPSLAWTGSEFGLSWEYMREGNLEVFFTPLSAEGTKIGSDLQVTSYSKEYYYHYPTISWTGSEFGLVWSDEFDVNNEIYFSRIGRNFSDKDGDGLRENAEYSFDTNPCAPDTDGDLLSDGDEVNLYGTNPLSPDTDGDGMGDDYEVHRPCLDPLVGDSALDGDTDGLSNIAEHGLGTEPCDPDSDGDELPDGWEDRYLGCAFDPISFSSETFFTKFGSDLRVTSDGHISENPSLSWTGSEYGVSWEDDRNGSPEIYFARISSTGAKLGPDLRVTTNYSTSEDPSLAWTGSEFGVSWDDGSDGNFEIYFARISASGSKIGSDLRVTSSSLFSFYPSLSWTGSEFGVCWYDDRDENAEIYFARISAAGSKIGSDLRVTSNSLFSFYPSLSWTGSEFGVCWNDDPDGDLEIYFARISSGGVKIGSDLRVTSNNGYSYSPSLFWTGSEYGVSWYDNREGNYEIYFARLSALGSKIGSDLRVTNNSSSSYSPSLLWTGSEYGVSWYDNREGNCEIYFAIVSAAGAKIGSDLRVTNNSSISYHPSLSWTGSDFGVSWYDGRDGNNEIYFARIAHQYTDKDGDGLREDGEYASGTDPCDPDTDDDLSNDGPDCAPLNPTIFPAAPELCDSIDNQCPGDPGYGVIDEGCVVDTDGDGLTDNDETYLYFTDPNDSDTDDDGVNDGDEVNAYGTNPNAWDTDGDYLPDPFEIANAANPAGPLDANSAIDGDTDFEPNGLEDGNPNYHEYWNGSNPWAKDPAPDRFANPSCYYWAEGDGDGVPGPGDLAVVKDEVATGSPTYSNVLPRGVFDTQDVDKDGVPGPGDISSVKDMVTGIDLPSGYPAMPVSLGVVSAPGGAVDVGDTCHVTLEVINQALAVTRSGSFAVVFSIDPASTGSAVLLGGEGEDLGQSFTNRYDVSGLSTAGGRANIVLKVTGAGTVIVRAKVPACGIGTTGRWCAEVVLGAPVAITVQ